MTTPSAPPNTQFTSSASGAHGTLSSLTRQRLTSALTSRTRPCGSNGCVRKRLLPVLIRHAAAHFGATPCHRLGQIAVQVVSVPSAIVVEYPMGGTDH